MSFLLVLAQSNTTTAPLPTLTAKPIVPVTLPKHRRGEPFNFTNALQDGWDSSMFPGGFEMTFRTDIPPSSQLDDTDLAASSGDSGGVIDKASSNGTTPEIVFSDATNFRVFIPSSRTRTWPLTNIVFDLKGVIDADNVYPLASGTLPLSGDVTRRV